MRKKESQEKRAERLNLATKKRAHSDIGRFYTPLDSAHRELLQRELDRRCNEIYDDYERKREDAFQRFVRASEKAAKETLSLYPVPGTAPHERPFFL